VNDGAVSEGRQAPIGLLGALRMYDCDPAYLLALAYGMVRAGLDPVRVLERRLEASVRGEDGDQLADEEGYAPRWGAFVENALDDDYRLVRTELPYLELLEEDLRRRGLIR
jgi:hypothetical protein